MTRWTVIILLWCVAVMAFYTAFEPVVLWYRIVCFGAGVTCSVYSLALWRNGCK